MIPLFMLLISMTCIVDRTIEREDGQKIATIEVSYDGHILGFIHREEKLPEGMEVDCV